MNEPLKKSVFLLSIFGMFFFSDHFALDHRSDPKNVALGRKYTLAPQPNYPLCRDEGDNVQLTDGCFSQGHFWKQKSTVGWKSARYVDITIDLDHVMPISGVSYQTAAGTAQVNWPRNIYIMVGQELDSFYYVGDLIQLSQDHGDPLVAGYRKHRYWTDKLSTYGRFVKLVICPDGPYTFTDEIEIYRDDSVPVDKQPMGRKTVDIDRFMNQIEATQLVQRRLRKDLADIRTAIKNMQTAGQWEKELSMIEAGISDVQGSADKNYRTVFPLNELHKRMFAVQAALWRTLFRDSLVIWQKHRWDMISPTEVPLSTGANVNVAMMKNEFRGAAFNISNCRAGSVNLTLSIVGLPEGTNPLYITVHDVPFTDTKSGIPVMAALPPAIRDGRHYLFQLDPGITRQIWLTFHTKELASGEYSGQIIIEPGSMRIPLHLKIYPFTFPQQPTLHLSGWDYTDQDDKYDVTVQNRAELVQHLRDHFVDSPWATSRVMPIGQYDQLGHLIKPPDASSAKKWIERWPNVNRYYVFLNAGRRFAQFDLGAPGFKAALANWITWWVNQFAEWNIKPEQIGLQLVDESRTPAQDAVIIEYARVLKAAQPKIIIWENPSWSIPQQADPELYHICDILCPQTAVWLEQGKPFADFYDQQRRYGKELWLYSCGAATKLLDPYAYYLVQHWLCWKLGAQGSAFWAFGDSNGASSWNEYVSLTGAFTPLFIEETKITFGKHMEAIREGIEDYEYLRMLSERVTGLEKRKIPESVLISAKALLDSGPDRVTAFLKHKEMFRWQEPKNRELADQVRLEVLEAMLGLSRW